MGRDFEIFKGLIEQMVDDDQDEFCRIQLPGFMANKLRGYFGIKSDLNLIRTTFLDYCNPDLNINRPVYYYMIVILYGKCFTNAASASHPNLEKKDVAKRKDLLEIHLELMDTRHNFIAHRGVTSQDDAVVYLTFEKKNPMNFRAGAKRGKREHFNGENPKKYVELFDYLICLVDERVQNLSKRLFKRLLEEFTNEELSLMLIPSKEIDTDALKK